MVLAQESPALNSSPPLAPSPTPAPSATTPTPESAASTTSGAQPKRNRAISSNLAATLAVGMPKFNPPKPVDKELENQEVPDLREIDKPKNEIIRLPKVVVEGSRPPVFTEREIYTYKAFGELLAKRYYSQTYLALNKFVQSVPLGALFLPSAADSAIAQYNDEERLKNMGSLNDAAADAAKAGDKAGSDYIKRASNETYMRQMDWGWEGPKK